ncbi:hypothetical protein V6N13_081253 [Hibiscus sabdariffa]
MFWMKAKNDIPLIDVGSWWTGPVKNVLSKALTEKAIWIPPVDGMKTNGDEDVVAETSVTDDDVAQIADDDDVVGMLFVAFLTCRIYRF